MKRFALARRERRTLIAGTATIGLLLVFSRGVPAWRAWRHDAAAAATEMLIEAEHAEAGVRALTAMRDSVAARGERFLALSPALMGGETSAAAAGALAGLVSRAATDANVQLGALQVHVDSTREHLFMRVSVRTTVTGDIRGVTRLLQALEHSPKLVAIRELSISQPEPGAPIDQPEALRLEIRVDALALSNREEDP